MSVHSSAPVGLFVGTGVLGALALSGHSDASHLASAGAALALTLVSGAVVWRSPRSTSAADPGVLDRVRQLESETATDPITGLGNLRSFDTELQREVGRALRHEHPVALALIEADALGDLTDRLGHMEGDKLLARLAISLGGRRAEDRTFRLTGGEFGLILPYTTAPEIFPLMESLRSETERSDLETTVTIGVADLTTRGDSATELRRRAESALGEAKRRGRNTVAAHPGWAVPTAPVQEAVATG